jgi:hypothetical protein
MNAHVEVRCLHCGYDLRGLPRTGALRCPECGTLHEPSLPEGTHAWRADHRFVPLMLAPGILCALAVPLLKWVAPGEPARVAVFVTPVIAFGLLWGATYGLLNGREPSFSAPWKRGVSAFGLALLLVPFEALVMLVTLMLISAKWLPMI